MKFAKIFKSGNSQALRLPKEFQFHAKEIEIFRRGFELLSSMPKNFFSDEREDTLPQEREFF